MYKGCHKGDLSIKGIINFVMDFILNAYTFTVYCQVSFEQGHDMGQVMKVRQSCYLVLLSFDSKPGNKTAAPS